MIAEPDVTAVNIERHQRALRSETLNVISEFTEEEIQGVHGLRKLADALTIAMRQKLMLLEGYSGIKRVRFTSFVLQ